MATAQLAFVPYERDTEVADVEPEESEMHVLILDEDGRLRWHRWLAGSNGSTTACANAVDHRHTHGTRYPVCKGEMCEDGCFSPLELVKAALANAAERRRNT